MYSPNGIFSLFIIYTPCSFSAMITIISIYPKSSSLKFTCSLTCEHHIAYFCVCQYFSCYFHGIFKPHVNRRLSVCHTMCNTYYFLTHIVISSHTIGTYIAKFSILHVVVSSPITQNLPLTASQREVFKLDSFYIVKRDPSDTGLEFSPQGSPCTILLFNNRVHTLICNYANFCGICSCTLSNVKAASCYLY